jgi:hypothetical protein
MWIGHFLNQWHYGGIPMPIYAISYDLNSPGQKYQRVKDAIESCGDSIKPMESFWLVDSNLTYSQISEKVRQAHDANDRHLVLRMSREYQGWLTQDAWDWINRRQHKLAA